MSTSNVYKTGRENSALDGLFEIFSSSPPTELVPTPLRDSTDADFGQLINDHIYGLLSLEEMSTAQINLLIALLKLCDP